MAFKKPVNLKYQVDCGPKNVDFKSLASFFETIFSALMNKQLKQDQLIANGQEFTVLLAELGFHYGRICNKAGNSTEALAVFDKLLKLQEVKTIAKMDILNYKYLHRFVVVFSLESSYFVELYYKISNSRISSADVIWK